MAVFRVEKTKDYTVISNHHLRDINLSLKAKGLLSLMLSLPETWNYTLTGLAQICKEGVDSIRSGIKELEEQGYIERHRIRNEKGQLAEAEYIIRECPAAPSKADEPTLEVPVQGTPIFEAPASENPTLDRTTQLNIDESNTDSIKYPSINQRVRSNDGDRWIDKYNQNIALIKNNIDYDALVYSYDKSIIDEIVAVMAEVLTVDAPYYTIEKKQYPTELVRARFLEIDYGKLEAFLLEFTRRNGKICNIKAYLISALFNVPATADTNLANMVRSDMYAE